MQHIVGADAHIGPFRSCEFAKILCGTGLPCRADVGIGPYSGNGPVCYLKFYALWRKK